MRVTVGTIAVLVLMVTVAVAQPPAQRERAAVLKPPVPLSPDQTPLYARGSGDTLSPSASALASTPVERPSNYNKQTNAGVASGPAWLNADSNMLPASGSVSKGGMVRQLTPPAAMMKEEINTPPKFIDRFKFTKTTKQPAANSVPVTLPDNNTQPAQPSPTASSPFRGTGANGASVFAGPPAYRWYGWGTVTPGANPLAPSGQYPKASANWYSITGATPGAFPVPVSNGTSTPPGTEPPTYGLARSTTPQQPMPVSVQPPIQSQPRPEVPQSQYNQAPDSKFPPAATTVSVPTITAPPIAQPMVPAATSEPTVAPSEPVVTTSEPAVAKQPTIPPTLPKQEPIPVAPPIASVEHVPPTLPTMESKTGTNEPKSLPTSVTTNPQGEELQWQPAKDRKPAAPQPGIWAPSHVTQPQQGTQPPPQPKPAEQTPPLQSKNVKEKPIVARGQMSDRTPDPVTTLIKQVCQGRADGVEVRWTGTKKLQVSFGTRTSAEAQKVVTEISGRPELTAYQIDFNVLVK